MSAGSKWYGDLAALPSLGATLQKAATLGELHEARRQNLAQFWTPTPVAALVWRIALEAIDKALKRKPGAKVRLIDTSIGSGRLVQFADPALHSVDGVDVHEVSVSALSDRLLAAGFEFTMHTAGMEQIKAGRGHYGVALINPPFSLHMETALLEPYACTAHGRFGPNSSALSHAYALHQALDLADVVVAILPRGYANDAFAERVGGSRLRALLHLPGAAFADEGTQVATSILVYGRERVSTPAAELRIQSLDDALPPFELDCMTTAESHGRPLAVRTCEHGTPAITLPATGDRKVRVVRRGSQIKLGFRCGLTQARVMNALLRRQIDRYADPSHRYPAGIDTEGQGILDIELHLMQADPLGSFQQLLSKIAQVGGVPSIDAGFLPYIRRRLRRLTVERTPIRHSILVPAGGDLRQDLDNAETLTATARHAHLLDPHRWGSPRIAAGAAVTLHRSIEPDGEYFHYSQGGVTARLSRAELLDRFELPAIAASVDEADQWIVRYEGRAKAFPQHAALLRRRAHALGLHRWLSWGFQLDDVIEMSMTAGGKVIGGHAMGLGKARMAVSLCLLGQGQYNLIVVEASLIDEFTAELRTLGVDRSQWQVIDSPPSLNELRQINLISYTRLRMPVHQQRPKATYAKALRGRLHTVIADEAHCVSNDESDQVRALYCLRPKRRYGLTGTPCGNYPRSLLPLIVWVAGDGTAAQVYGRRRPYMTPELLRTMIDARRGVDVFREKFVTVEWCTYEWAESMTEGAKREVPTLSSLDAYRAYAGRFVLRRLWEEPEVARYIRIPTPDIQTIELEWDDAHLAYYLAVAEEFAQWWRAARSGAVRDGKRVNLVAILARLGAVFQAANYPQGLDGPAGAYAPLTSKQRTVVDYLAGNHAAGRKTIVFATSPNLLSLLAGQLDARGVESVLYTGRVPLRRRTLELNQRFRHGSCSTLLASFGVGQAGLNLPQASDEVFYNRCWSPRQEQQALYRALRPQQKNELRVARFHLRGSLDQYMARMVAMKVDASRAGLDWGTPEYSAHDFEHWLSILDSFCNEIAQLRNIKRHDLKEHLCHAA